ncbi:MAG: T9SS type A sorting domain-containing protein [Flavobacteriales bacterium]|nr:T9SS type A sorting domain-containing protein [Flavobacteriales bacterium]
MFRTASIAFILICGHLPVHSMQWHVGPGQPYTAPSQVSGLVGNGDTVNIAAGTYPSDVARWQANDLLLRGIGGMAHLESNGNAWGEKGIWVIQGDRTTVEWIEFSECSVPDQNGAGIRQEGHHLTVLHCYFHNNENGILAGTPNAMPSNITIEHCEFAHNGFGDGFSHNLYINYTDTLWFRYNYSHQTNVGHELKSRANVNFIEYNRFSNEQNGSASREIDLPDGGQAYVIGNVLQQGLQGQNSNMIGYGLESMSNPGPHELYAINNTLVNERTVGSFFSMNSGTVFKAYNNILAGQGQFVANFFPLQTDTAGNLKQPVFALIGFADPNNYNYRITDDSPAHNIGIPAGLSSSGYPLVAWDEYVHPTGRTVRCQHALLDAGAFETCTTDALVLVDHPWMIWPNPAHDRVNINALAGAKIVLIDAQGRLLRTMQSTGMNTIELLGIASGIYVLRVEHNGARTDEKLIIE